MSCELFFFSTRLMGTQKVLILVLVSRVTPVLSQDSSLRLRCFLTHLCSSVFVWSLEVSGLYLFAALPSYPCCLRNYSHLPVLGLSPVFPSQKDCQPLPGLSFVAQWPRILSRQQVELIVRFTCLVFPFLGVTLLCCLISII